MVQTSFSRQTAIFVPADQMNGNFQSDKFTRSEEKSDHFAELSDVEERKIVCSLDLLQELIEGCCQQPGCILPVFVTTKIVGVTAILEWSCSAGHKGRFCSSRKVRGLYANNVQVAAAILLSGNNQQKISRLFQFAAIPAIDKNMFFRYQRHLFFPVIQEWWIWMKDAIIAELSVNPVVLAGDGQFDSPGKSAKFLSYFLLDIATNYIVHVQIMDKRMTGGKSVVMEVKALTRSLENLIQVLNMAEVVTDASASVIKEMSKICHCKSSSFQNVCFKV